MSDIILCAASKKRSDTYKLPIGNYQLAIANSEGAVAQLGERIIED